jgi:hypothetical protein
MQMEMKDRLLRVLPARMQKIDAARVVFPQQVLRQLLRHTDQSFQRLRFEVEEVRDVLFRNDEGTAKAKGLIAEAFRAFVRASA